MDALRYVAHLPSQAAEALNHGANPLLESDRSLLSSHPFDLGNHYILSSGLPRFELVNRGSYHRRALVTLTHQKVGRGCNWPNFSFLAIGELVI